MSTSSGDWTTLVPVTGEAVALDLRIAQFPSRTLGLSLDLLVQFVALWAMVVWRQPVHGRVPFEAALPLVELADAIDAMSPFAAGPRRTAFDQAVADQE